MQISLEKRLQTRSLEKHIAEEDVLGKAGASKRQLVPRDSDVTMGSEDIPDMFKTPASKKAKAASGLEKPSPSSSKLVCQQRPGSRLHAAMGYDLEKSRKKAKPKAKPVLKRQKQATLIINILYCLLCMV